MKYFEQTECLKNLATKVESSENCLHVLSFRCYGLRYVWNDLQLVCF